MNAARTEHDKFKQTKPLEPTNTQSHDAEFTLLWMQFQPCNLRKLIFKSAKSDVYQMVCRHFFQFIQWMNESYVCVVLKQIYCE